MEQQNKELYETPWTQVIELKMEGVIAASGPQPDYVNPFGTEQGW